MEDLHGRTALITGAARRVGRAIALRLATEGIHIVLSYHRSSAAAERTTAEIEALGVRALAVHADLSTADPAACNRLIEEAGRLTGAIDILVNNASDFSRTPLVELERDPAALSAHFERMVSLHLRAPFLLGLKLGLAMKQRGWGRIVNMLDRVVPRGQAYADWSLYLLTKYGLYGINQVLALELAPEVAVNGIAPGMVIGPENLSADEIAGVVQRIPLGHEMGVDEIADDVWRLVRSRSKTGSVVLTDGGSGLRTF